MGLTNSWPRHIVADEDGVPLRAFWTKEEAQRFMQEGFSLWASPKITRRDILKSLLESVGESPY